MHDSLTDYTPLLWHSTICSILSDAIQLNVFMNHAAGTYSSQYIECLHITRIPENLQKYMYI